MDSDGLVSGGDTAVRLMRRMLVTTWVAPYGWEWKVRHDAGCVNAGDGAFVERLLARGMEGRASMSVAEVKAMVVGVLVASRCYVGCGLLKDDEMGMLLQHSQ